MGSHDVIRLGQGKTLNRGYSQNKGVCVLSSVVYIPVCILGEWIEAPVPPCSDLESIYKDPPHGICVIPSEDDITVVSPLHLLLKML